MSEDTEELEKLVQQFSEYEEISESAEKQCKPELVSKVKLTRDWRFV